MPKFKNLKTGDIIEVTEEHAAQVLRPQGSYVEVVDSPKEFEVVSTKKKTKKKTNKKG